MERKTEIIAEVFAEFLIKRGNLIFKLDCCCEDTQHADVFNEYIWQIQRDKEKWMPTVEEYQ